MDLSLVEVPGTGLFGKENPGNSRVEQSPRPDNAHAADAMRTTGSHSAVSGVARRHVQVPRHIAPARVRRVLVYDPSFLSCPLARTTQALAALHTPTPARMRPLRRVSTSDRLQLYPSHPQHPPRRFEQMC